MRLKQKQWLLFALMVSISVLPQLSDAEHTRVTHPNVIGVEMLGRGLLYSVQFDRMLDDDFAAGISLGTVSAQSQTVTLIPVYMNYYFKREQGSLLATAGVDVVASGNSANGSKATVSGLEFPSNSVLPLFGFGYENRSDANFLFRVNGYGIIASTFIPWIGFTFGYAF